MQAELGEFNSYYISSSEITAYNQSFDNSYLHGPWLDHSATKKPNRLQIIAVD